MGIKEFLKESIKSNQGVSEADIEKAFCKYAKSESCTAYKLILLNLRGFPDRTVLCPGGKVLFIEFKRKHGKISSAQLFVKRALCDLGFQYHICDEIGQAEKILDRFLNE